MGSSLNQVSSAEDQQSCRPPSLFFYFWQFSVLIFAKGNKSQAVSTNRSARSKVRVADPSFIGRREVLEKRRTRKGKRKSRKQTRKGKKYRKAARKGGKNSDAKNAVNRRQKGRKTSKTQNKNKLKKRRKQVQKKKAKQSKVKIVRKPRKSMKQSPKKRMRKGGRANNLIGYHCEYVDLCMIDRM